MAVHAVQVVIPVPAAVVTVKPVLHKLQMGAGVVIDAAQVC